MKINVYDFDKTIYNGDSSIDLYFFCLKRYPKIIRCLPKQLLSFAKYGLGKIEKEALKESYFSFLSLIPSAEDMVIEFWNTNRHKIKDWYANEEHEIDIIVSASPEFLLEPICKELQTKDLIATKVDKYSGKFLSKNCHGQEKVERLLLKYPNARVEKCYSDSLSDQPLFKISREAYMVKKNRIHRLIE